MVLTYPANLQMIDDRVKRRLLTPDSTQDPTDSVPDHWRVERRRDAINAAQQTVYLLLCQKFEDEYFTRSRDDVTPHNNTIQLPDDTRRVMALDKRVGTTWVPVKIVSAARYREYSLPYLDSRTLYVTPISEVWTQVGKQLRMEGPGTASGTYRIKEQIRLIDLQGKDDPCQIPLEYQEALVFHAAALLAQDAGQDDRAAALRMLYAQEEAKIIATATNLNLAKRTRVRNVRYSPTWW